ncbi:MAG: hypothetical protein LBQ66_16615 [Planctomycetaceae bacterium]|nr:hypothetical protein [Planctomycetaceae bacterium]
MRRRLADSGGIKTHRQNQSVLRFGRFGFADAFSAPLFSSCFARRKHNRLAVGCPPYDHQPVLAFSSNLFGSITHRGGRDARVPVRAASRQLSATPTGDG